VPIHHHALRFALIGMLAMCAVGCRGWYRACGYVHHSGYKWKAIQNVKEVALQSDGSLVIEAELLSSKDHGKMWYPAPFGYGRIDSRPCWILVPQDQLNSLIDSAIATRAIWQRSYEESEKVFQDDYPKDDFSRFDMTIDDFQAFAYKRFYLNRARQLTDSGSVENQTNLESLVMIQRIPLNTPHKMKPISQFEIIVVPYEPAYLAYACINEEALSGQWRATVSLDASRHAQMASQNPKNVSAVTRIGKGQILEYEYNGQKLFLDFNELIEWNYGSKRNYAWLLCMPLALAVDILRIPFATAEDFGRIDDPRFRTRYGVSTTKESN